MKPEQAKALREPFPKSAVGSLPRKGRREDGSTYMVFLDYVGHAAVTDRLLEVDPEWYWEPVAVDDRGLPAFDSHGGLWIRLVVGEIARLGYGDAQGKTGPNAVKEAIGDAIRNAAMRFGVALDLWSKEDLHAADDYTAALADGAHDPAKVSRGPAADDPWASEAEITKRSNERGMRIVGDAPATKPQINKIAVLFHERGIMEREDRLRFVNELIAPEGPVPSANNLTKAQASKIIDALAATPVPADLGTYAGT